MGYNLRIITSTGEIISAGFTDFTVQLGDGESQIEDVSGDMPPNIATHYKWNSTSEEVEAYETPKEKKIKIKKDADKAARKSSYDNITGSNLAAANSRIAFIAEALGFTDPE